MSDTGEAAVRTAEHTDAGLRQNLIANFLSQAYVGLVGIVVLPLYLRQLGAEAYGLVGFFLVLQSWSQILDFGLSATLVREVARFRAGGSSAGELRSILRIIEWFLFGVGTVIAIALWGASSWIARTWLVPRELPLPLVASCISLMGVAIVFRWISGLERGVLIGFERQVGLAWFNVGVASLRFLGALIVVWIDRSPRVFFQYQVLVAVLELSCLLLFTRRLLPPGSTSSGRTLEQIKPALRFSLSLTFGSFVWLLTTQFDKLILSRLLPLADYGYFTLGTTLAGSITLVMTPVSQAILPRMMVLLTQGDHEGVKALYRGATQVMTVIVAPAVGVLVFYSSSLVGAWTGDPLAASTAGPVLFWYALGNGLLAVAAFPYYLQYVFGNLKLHVLGNVFFVVAFTPMLIFATIRWGALGAGRAWFIINLLYFFAWTPLVHRRFFKGLHKDWMLRDIVPAALAGAAAVLIPWLLVPSPSRRFPSVVLWLAIGIVSLVAAGAASSVVRRGVLARFRKASPS